MGNLISNFNLLAGTGVVHLADGTKEWYRNSKRHRDDGPAVEWASGNKEWWRNGERHRDNGPAVELPDGSKAWYREGRMHRHDGPAVEWASGNKDWCLEGRMVSAEEFTAIQDRKQHQQHEEKERLIEREAAVMTKGLAQSVTLMNPFRFKRQT